MHRIWNRHFFTTSGKVPNKLRQYASCCLPLPNYSICLLCQTLKRMSRNEDLTKRVSLINISLNLSVTLDLTHWTQSKMSWYWSPEWRYLHGVFSPFASLPSTFNIVLTLKSSSLCQTSFLKYPTLLGSLKRWSEHHRSILLVPVCKYLCDSSSTWPPSLRKYWSWIM